MRPFALCALILVLVACDNSGVLLGPGGTGSRFQLDDSDVVPAEVLAPYSAQLAVVGYDGVTTWELSAGELPPGLGLQGSGAVSGTPTWLGSYEFDVRVTAEGLGELIGAVSLDVVPGAADLQLGWRRDQTTNLTDIEGLMWGPWTRLAEAGLDQATVVLDVGVYTAGLDGQHSHGAGDDLRVGDLDPGSVSVVEGVWVVVGNQEAEGSPMEYLGDLAFQAGTDTGTLPVTLQHPDYESVETRVVVTPPDWCPTGEHDGGGSPGACS